MKVFVGADHNGFHLKSRVVEYLQKRGYEVIDEGDKQFNPDDDFPQYAARTVSALLAAGDPDARGVLICGSGQGMCIAANRFKGIRASLVWDVKEARAARNDDDSNILCLPARSIEKETAFKIIDAWMNTSFAAAPRFIRRLKQIDELN